MDDKRFDSITRAFAKSGNRRTLLKGILGLGGVAAIGLAATDDGSEAARRTPSPSPTPKLCPGVQTRVNGVCVCPSPLVKCGPDCCNSTAVPPGNPNYSECCDNACCFGTCLPEEICCPTNNRGTAQNPLPPLSRVCPTPNGNECCAYSSECCTIDGCCDTVCTGGTDGKSFCCSESSFCPGGTTSSDLCCTGATPIGCKCGTNANVCIADDDSACCVDADCDTPPSGSSPCAVGTCRNNVCVYTDCNSQSEICCPDNTGKYACRVGDECCLSNRDCADTCEACVNFVCVDDPSTFPCGPQNDPDKYCCPSTNYSICCNATQFECCGYDSATGVTRECDADGKCCEAGTPYFCAGSNTCCSAPCVEFDNVEYCCPPNRGRVCPGATSFVCCPNGQECSDDGDCCPSGSTACGDTCCTSDQQCCFESYCAAEGATCCDSDDDCSSLDYCDGSTWHNFTCGQGGVCLDNPTECNDANLCTVDTCDPSTGCRYTPVVCNTPGTCQVGPGTCNPSTGQCDYPPLVCPTAPNCFTGPGTCSPSTGQCVYTPVVCNTPPNSVCYQTTGVCDTSDGLCDYTPLAANTPCGTCLLCDGSGNCNVPDPACACVDIGDPCVDGVDTCCDGGYCCLGVCVTPDSECGQCISQCTGPDKCCCFNSNGNTFTCTNIDTCEDGPPQFSCVN